jgi:hypothetical protein
VLLLLCLQAHAQLSAEGGAALLQLAFNCSNPQTVAAAVGHLPVTAAATALDMPKLLEPNVARRLLLTAATKQHKEALEQMVQLGYLQQHVDATVLEAMLGQLLKHRDGVECSEALLRLPTAEQLSSNAVLRLLLDRVVANKETVGSCSHVQVCCASCQPPCSLTARLCCICCRHL